MPHLLTGAAVGASGGLGGHPAEPRSPARNGRDRAGGAAARESRPSGSRTAGWSPASTGVTAGDHVGYLLGRRYGGRMRELAVVRRLGVRHWDRATAAPRRHGAAAVFVTRLIPIVRTLTPAAVGFGAMTRSLDGRARAVVEVGDYTDQIPIEGDVERLERGASPAFDSKRPVKAVASLEGLPDLPPRGRGDPPAIGPRRVQPFSGSWARHGRHSASGLDRCRRDD
ncbi:VTT domain-containing protein [Streptosporangium canum]|uniref:DedA family protein n=1 Tax=Streptosporangium canum TaxID=324952 RepID=UPI003439F0ED